MEDSMQTLTVAYSLLALVLGVVIGWLLYKSRSIRELQEMVDERVAQLRARTIEETKSEIQRTLTSDLEDKVREELKEKLKADVEEEVQRTARKLESEAETKAQERIRAAEKEAKELLSAAKKEMQEETASRRQELEKSEARLTQRASSLDAREEKLEKRTQELATKDAELMGTSRKLKDREAELEAKSAGIQAELERVAGLSADAARAELVDSLTGEAKLEAAKVARQYEEEAIEEADRRAKKVIATSVQRWAGEYVAERAVTVVPIPNDEIKGRIIGREGRNIRALEAATGIDIIIDDTPEAVMVSGFDPVRRQVARISLEKLISDGRIHPSRIEEVVEKTSAEVESQIKEYGERAAFELGIHNLHIDLIKLVGRLQFRTSYGQNMWSHSIEVGFLCGMMAAELGLNVKHARRAGLLHDIGKALTHENDGPHALVGAEIAKRCGEHEVVRNAIAAHHNEEPQNSAIAHLVIAADALSGARPGARREVLGTYIKRLEDLERISQEFEGVEKAYAVQAGREIRVMVENSRVSDDQAFVLSKEIAAKIESELTYPGQIKVCVIRETRSVDYAR